MGELLKLAKINKSFGKGNVKTKVLDVDLKVADNEIIAIIGQSGCGKSTLLQMIGLLDYPTHGNIFINDIDCTKIKDRKKTEIRLNQLGFIYQFHHLMPEFSALENVMLPLIIAGIDNKIALTEATKILKDMGLSSKLNSRPAQLSGGEKQRIAIARSLINEPNLLLADEPTGNLDPQNSAIIFDMFVHEVRMRNMSAIIATHNLELAGKADKIFTIENKALKKVKKILP